MVFNRKQLISQSFSNSSSPSSSKKWEFEHANENEDEDDSVLAVSGAARGKRFGAGPPFCRVNAELRAAQPLALRV
jgi:hypothetical protein